MVVKKEVVKRRSEIWTFVKKESKIRSRKKGVKVKTLRHPFFIGEILLTLARQSAVEIMLMCCLYTYLLSVVIETGLAYGIAREQYCNEIKHQN